ncbi:unnamed protein product [Rangifer tarandus platyrhynchus]|uniref:Uncharacterized protein n=1 Tax=Rangifer tarandus platyrhynchus TaxID=3082113 RepID=A0AC59ZG05_RANTA
MLARRHLLLWKQPVTALEAAAVTAVAEIPVHVAQKRIEAPSPGSSAAPQSLFVAPGHAPSRSLSLGSLRPVPPPVFPIHPAQSTARLSAQRAGGVGRGELSEMRWVWELTPPTPGAARQPRPAAPPAAHVELYTLRE